MLHSVEFYFSEFYFSGKKGILLPLKIFSVGKPFFISVLSVKIESFYPPYFFPCFLKSFSFRSGFFCFFGIYSPFRKFPSSPVLFSFKNKIFYLFFCFCICDDKDCFSEFWVHINRVFRIPLLL